jgi:Outer membrane protein and related peptidoglycan-associated (lipo)proteins
MKIVRLPGYLSFLLIALLFLCIQAACAQSRQQPPYGNYSASAGSAPIPLPASVIPPEVTPGTDTTPPSSKPVSAPIAQPATGGGTGPGSNPGGSPANVTAPAPGHVPGAPSAAPSIVPGTSPAPAPGANPGALTPGTPLPSGAIPPYNLPSDRGISSYPPAYRQDLTDKLVLKRGLKIIFPVKNGLDTRWKKVGDYEFVADVQYNDKRGYCFDWHMTPPANCSGSRSVEIEDVANSHKLSLFYPDKEFASLIGYSSIVRASDYIYQKLKAGEQFDFSLDGPDAPLVLRQESKPVAHQLNFSANEMVDILVDGYKVPVRTVRGTTDAGWSYWLLDNPNFPLLVKGDGPFNWEGLALAYDGGLFPPPPAPSKAGDADKARREAEKIIKGLKDKGQATSYLILFDFDSDKLRPLSKQILTNLSQYLKSDPDVRLRVEGHTCTIGGGPYNMNLSKRRAASVKRFLSENCGIKGERLASAGFGYTKPVASNKTESGRRKNRRVVFSELNWKP